LTEGFLAQLFAAAANLGDQTEQPVLSVAGAEKLGNRTRD